MRLSSVFAAAIVAFALVGAPSLRANVLVTIVPQTQTIALGSSTSVQIGISGLGLDAPPSLGGFDFNLAFNPSLVTFTGLTFGDPILGDQLNLSGTGAISDFSIQAPGLLEFFELSLDPATTLDSQQSDHFVLATLQFQAIATGRTSLFTSINSIADSQGYPFETGLQAGSLTVSPASSVPEPSSFALAGVGIAILIFCRRQNHY